MLPITVIIILYNNIIHTLSCDNKAQTRWWSIFKPCKACFVVVKTIKPNPLGEAEASVTYQTEISTHCNYIDPFWYWVDRRTALWSSMEFKQIVAVTRRWPFHCCLHLKSQNSALRVLCSKTTPNLQWRSLPCNIMERNFNLMNCIKELEWKIPLQICQGIQTWLENSSSIWMYEAKVNCIQKYLAKLTRG